MLTSATYKVASCFRVVLLNVPGFIIFFVNVDTIRETDHITNTELDAE